MLVNWRKRSACRYCCASFVLYDRPNDVQSHWRMCHLLFHWLSKRGSPDMRILRNNKCQYDASSSERAIIKISQIQQNPNSESFLTYPQPQSIKIQRRTQSQKYLRILPLQDTKSLRGKIRFNSISFLSRLWCPSFQSTYIDFAAKVGKQEQELEALGKGGRFGWLEPTQEHLHGHLKNLTSKKKHVEGLLNHRKQLQGMRHWESFLCIPGVAELQGDKSEISLLYSSTTRSFLMAARVSKAQSLTQNEMVVENK